MIDITIRRLPDANVTPPEWENFRKGYPVIFSSTGSEHAKLYYIYKLFDIPQIKNQSQLKKQPNEKELLTFRNADPGRIG
jgi:hypothetical protein